MQAPMQTPFLEDYLRAAAVAVAVSSSSPSPPAAAILQAWSSLRDPSVLSRPDLLLSSLRTLSPTPSSSLHLSDPQAKLLLSLLLSSSSSSSSSLPPSALPLLLSLLSVWLRKSPRPSPSLLSPLLRLLPSHPSPHAVLVLGTLALHDSSRGPALDLLCRLLEAARPQLVQAPDVFLAGIGYALSKSEFSNFRRILGYLLGIWDDGCGLSPNLAIGLMLLRLVEWLVMGFLNSLDFDKIEALCGEVSPEMCEQRGYLRFAVVMASAGALRAFRIASSRNKKLSVIASMGRLVEGSLFFVAKSVALSSVSDSEKRLLLQCISLGLVRCGPISFDPHVFHCLCLALLNENFPLLKFLKMGVEYPDQISAIDVFKQVKEHLDSVLFKEAGAVTGVLCKYYTMADEESKLLVENEMWKYSQEVYSNLRLGALILRGRNDVLLEDLEKIAEAAFLMVVVFAGEVTKQKLTPKSSDVIQSEASLRILVAFSCVEYLRRVRLPEYTDVIRRAVLTIQENAAPCALFIESMPSYVELTNQEGLQHLEGKNYIWCNDEVQNARILFYLRVIPTCISLIPGSLFGNAVAPTMFLYMLHPNGKVARAAHSVFVAFVSSGKDTEQDDRSTLKEQLVFYYVQRALEAYPGITLFEGLASGISALVRHLPAGSPAIFYCVHSLVEKARDLCREEMNQDGNVWSAWEGNTEPCKKTLELLIRLISLVDIQVLPYVLKLLAELIVNLPKDGQDVLLDQLYAHVAESDDVTRKPVLVSWLQSLSYISTQMLVKSSSSARGADVGPNNGSIYGSDSLSLNRTRSCL